MRALRRSVLALSLLVPLAALASPRTVPVGPGAVVEMHRSLFAALDRGDEDAVRAMISTRGHGTAWTPEDGWSEAGGATIAIGDTSAPLGTLDAAAGAKRLLAWGGGAGTRTSIRRAWSDCASDRISFAVLELERTRLVEGVERTEAWRCTSLVSHEGGRWVLWHLHASRL